MSKLKTKLIVGMVVFVLAILAMTLSVYAANENVSNVKVVKMGSDYIVYIKECQKEAFKFAFLSELTDPLVWRDSEEDSKGNWIIYIDSDIIDEYFDAGDPVYLWVEKSGGTLILDEEEFFLSDFIDMVEISAVEKITQIIKVTPKTEVIKTEVIDGATYLESVGKLVITNPPGTYEFQIKDLTNPDYARFFALAEIISQDFKGYNTMFAKLEVLQEFIQLNKKLFEGLNAADWKLAVDEQIYQPENIKYVVWIRNTSGTLVDVQFMYPFEDNQRITDQELVETRLPVMGEDDTLLIVLGGLIVAIGIMSVVVIRLSKKEKTGK